MFVAEDAKFHEFNHHDYTMFYWPTSRGGPPSKTTFSKISFLTNRFVKRKRKSDFALKRKRVSAQRRKSARKRNEKKQRLRKRQDWNGSVGKRKKNG